MRVSSRARASSTSVSGASALRVLIFHTPGFEQDITTLREARPADAEIHQYSTLTLSEHFLRLFPADVLSTDMTLYWKPSYEERRRAWGRVADGIVDDLLRRFPFDIALAPADDTPYWRAVLAALQGRRIPYAVLLKELMQPPGRLRVLAPLLRQHYPEIADLVMVSSPMTAEFEIAAGADPARVHVTGQPKFDAYGRLARARSYGDLGIPVDPAKPSVLFLSYEADAYLAVQDRVRLWPSIYRSLVSTDPEATPDDALAKSWIPQRSDTARVIVAHAARAGWNVVVKPHLQMDAADRSFDRRLFDAVARRSGLGAVHYLDGALDSRPLIMAADVVVGFQTQALLEAMAAGKAVAYTHWSTLAREDDDLLIPYAAWPDALDTARSPAELKAALEHPAVVGKTARRSEIVERWLGPIDGHASERVWDLLRRTSGAAKPSARGRTPSDGAARRSLWLRSRAVGALATASRAIAKAVPRLATVERRIARLHARTRQRCAELAARSSDALPYELVGPFAAPLWRELWEMAARAPAALLGRRKGSGARG